jgi:hypothetical protein
MELALFVLSQWVASCQLRPAKRGAGGCAEEGGGVNSKRLCVQDSDGQQVSELINKCLCQQP